VGPSQERDGGGQGLDSSDMGMMLGEVLVDRDHNGQIVRGNEQYHYRCERVLVAGAFPARDSVNQGSIPRSGGVTNGGVADWEHFLAE
jgi:hypothetical protein